jgi:hypothetical protein
MFLIVGQDKMENSINAMRSGQIQFKEKFTDTRHKQLKDVTALIEQSTTNLHEEFSTVLQASRGDLEATRRELETRMAAAEGQTTSGVVGNAGTRTDRVKLLKFDLITLWAVFHR